jgi:acyl-CoA thioester hydrolase/1,4-dihydroxy-2-naphthoyl-CoA hydrolase
MSYLSQVKVHFHQVDAAGVLFYGHVFSLAHNIYEEFITQGLGFDWEQWFNNSNWAVPIRHAEADYLQPLLGGHTYNAKIDIIEVGTSSFRLQFLFSEKADDKCMVKTTHVFIDKKMGAKVPIPKNVCDELRQCLKFPKHKDAKV